MRKKIIVLLLLNLWLFSCQKEDPVVTSISLPSTFSVDVGTTQKITVSHLPADLPTPAYSWQTSDASIFTVDNQGNITALKVGEATLTVRADNSNLSATSQVTILPIEASSIEITPKSVSLLVGESIQLEGVVLPENTTDKTITWSSSNDQVAKVSDGIVTGVGAGKTTITASCGTASSSCEVKVDPVKVTGLRLSNENVRMEMSDIIQLSAIVSPENATNNKVNWRSTDTNIAKVDENGLVTGINEGTTRIIATSQDGNFSASCEVAVVLKGLVLTKTHMRMVSGTTELIHVLYSTNENAYLNATWTSSNPNVAVVTGDGAGTNSAVIEAKGLGTATINATSSDGTKKASCTVEVVDITSFIDLSFITYSITTINGFVYGDIYSKITNNSSYPIELTSFYVYDGYSGRLIAQQDPTEVNKLFPGENTNLGTKFNSVYYPIFKWNFKWNGKDYSIQHQYSGSTRSVNATNEKLFKI
ncbi:MAG TPA: Ig domain-containing protein [Petrimonas sp.]|uniref:Ig-like domain-containing protein n=1 Tax=Petrimonas sp. TaxID=2023866 RepID=UPI00175D5EBB|nr:Ig domain-containing protein [Petrimonas sp.]